MSQRFVIFIEASTEQDAAELVKQLFSLPRDIGTVSHPVTMGVVDVTDQIVVNQLPDRASA